MFDFSVYGSSQPFKWTHEHLVKVLSTGKEPVLTDPLIINAFRAIDRAKFVPDELQEFAYADKWLDLGYDEKMISPSTAAQLLQTLRPKLNGNYLQLGTGSGYLAALLGFLTGENGRVHSIERIQWLHTRARDSIRTYPSLAHVNLIFGNGQFGLKDKAPYDGIIITYHLEDVPQHLFEQLADGGKLLAPTLDYGLKVIEKAGPDRYLEELKFGYAFAPGKPGVA